MLILIGNIIRNNNKLLLLLLSSSSLSHRHHHHSVRCSVMWLLCYSTSSMVAMPKLKWSDYCKGPDLIPCGTRKSFFPSTSAFPYHHYSTNGPYSCLIHLQLMLCSLCTVLLNESLLYLFLSSLPEIFFSTLHIELIFIFALFPGFQTLLAPTSAG